LKVKAMKPATVGTVQAKPDLKRQYLPDTDAFLHALKLTEKSWAESFYKEIA